MLFGCVNLSLLPQARARDGTLRGWLLMAAGARLEMEPCTVKW